MTRIQVTGIQPAPRFFHNESLNVYPKTVKFEDISYWPRNNRTLLSLELFKKKQSDKKPLTGIPLQEIVAWLADQAFLQIPRLADSVNESGVRVPLIVLDNGTLLDGNRRYFACAYLKFRAEKKGATRPAPLDTIPVWVIRAKDVTPRLKLKILAEANFVPDLKVPWPLDVKAAMVTDHFKRSLKRTKSVDKAYKEIYDVFSVEKQEVDAYTETMRLTNAFVKNCVQVEKERNRADAEQDHARMIVQQKFVFFWEFRNKALAGSGQLNGRQLRIVQPLFFKMMRNERIKNLKQVEPMLRSINDPYVWKLLADSGGAKMDLAEALYKEGRATRSAEDKIKAFVQWLRRKFKAENPSTGAMNLIRTLKAECGRLLGGKS